MPRAKAEKVFSNFSKGLITEASALAFPENAYVSGDNVEIDIKGKASRRLGIDIEPGVVNETVYDGDDYFHTSGVDYLSWLFRIGNLRDVASGSRFNTAFSGFGDGDFEGSGKDGLAFTADNDTWTNGLGEPQRFFRSTGTSLRLAQPPITPAGRSVGLNVDSALELDSSYFAHPGHLTINFWIKIEQLGVGPNPLWICGFTDGDRSGVDVFDVDHAITLNQNGTISVTLVDSFESTTFTTTTSYTVGQVLHISSAWQHPTASVKGKYIMMVNNVIEIDKTDETANYFQTSSNDQKYSTLSQFQFGGQGISGSNTVGNAGPFILDDLWVSEVSTAGTGYYDDYKIATGDSNPHTSVYTRGIVLPSVGPSEAAYLDFISRIKNAQGPVGNGDQSTYYQHHWTWSNSDTTDSGNFVTPVDTAVLSGATFVDPITTVSTYKAVSFGTSGYFLIQDNNGDPGFYAQGQISAWVIVPNLPAPGDYGFIFGDIYDVGPGSVTSNDFLKAVLIDSDGYLHLWQTGFNAGGTIAGGWGIKKSRNRFVAGQPMFISVAYCQPRDMPRPKRVLSVNGVTEAYDDVKLESAGAPFYNDNQTNSGGKVQQSIFGGVSVSIFGFNVVGIDLTFGDILITEVPVSANHFYFKRSTALMMDSGMEYSLQNTSGDFPVAPNDADAHYQINQALYISGVIDQKYNAFRLTSSELYGSEKYTFLKWTSVNGASGDDVLVVAGGNRVVFYDLRAQLLTFEVIGGFDLQGVSGGTNNNRIALAAGSGRLYVSGDNINPQVVELDIVNKIVTITLIKIQVRDLEGIDEGIAVDFNPLALDDDHRYNLINQGWPLGEIVRYYRDRKKTKIRGATPESAYFASRRNYPSNAEPYAFYVDGSGTLDVQTANVTIGTSPAPKGRLFLDAFNQRRGANVGLNTTASSKITARRPTSIAFYAGRVWYSGVTDKDFIGKVYFSQVIKTDAEAGKCHQENDPTSPELNDLLATDGGVIDVPEAGNIQSMNTLGNGLLLFADNGIWVVRGGEGTFSASNFSVDKIHDASILAPDTLVQAENAIYFLGKNSIYAVQEDSTGLRFVAQSISETTIQTFYNAISENSKKESTGAYIQSQQRVVWLYSGDEQYSVRSKYTNGLVFDLKLGAFTTFTIGDQDLSPKLFGVIEKTTQNVDIGVEVVTVDGEAVTVDGEDVTVSTFTPIDTTTEVKFIAAAEDKGSEYLVFSAFTDRQFVDWRSVDDVGVDYSSFFETGFDSLGDLIRNKKAPYLWAFMTQTEDGFSLDTDLGGGAKTVTLDNPSSCLLQYKWDWSDSEASKRWSSKRQVYRLKQFIPEDENDPFDYGYEIVETRNKVRGSGKSLKLRFESETGKDMQIEGWAIEYSAGGRRSKT